MAERDNSKENVPPEQHEGEPEPMDTTEAAPEVDPSGYKVEQRAETEQRTQTKEVREIDGRTEVSLKDAKEIKLEEIKSKEVFRKATPEEIRALLEAEFEGRGEIQISKEITMEEFTRLETQRERTVDGEKKTEVTTSEEHKSDESREGPEWLRSVKQDSSGPDGSGNPDVEEELIASAEAPKAEAFFSLPSIQVKLPSIKIEGNLPSFGLTGSGGISGEVGGSSVDSGTPVKSELESDADIKGNISANLPDINIHGQLPSLHIGGDLSGSTDHHSPTDRTGASINLPTVTGNISLGGGDGLNGGGGLGGGAELGAGGGLGRGGGLGGGGGLGANISGPNIDVNAPNVNAQGGGNIELGSLSGNINLPTIQTNVSGSGGLHGNIDGQENMNINVKPKMRGVKDLFKKKTPRPYSTGDIQVGVQAGGDVNIGGSGILSPSNPESGKGFRHEVKHKRHVIEEIIIEDSDKYYEKFDTHSKTLPVPKKKSKLKVSGDISGSADIHKSADDIPNVEIKEGGKVTDPSGDVTFVVEYEPPPPAGIDINLPSIPKIKADWRPFGKKPKLDKGVELSGDVDVNIPDAPNINVDADIDADAGIKIKSRKQKEQVIGGDLEIEDGSGFRMPSIHLPKFKGTGKGPSASVSADAGLDIVADDKLKTDPDSITFVVKGNLPSGKVKVKGGSQDELNVGGDVDVKGGGGFKMPSIHMPDINFPSLKRGGKGDASVTVNVEGPDVNVSGDLSGGDVIKGDAGVKIKGKQPEVVVGGDVDIEDGSGFKMPDIHLPKFKIGGKGPKAAVSADAGINVDGSTDPESITFVVKGDVPSGNIKVKGGSQDEIAVGGDVDVKGGGGFKMPSIHMPDINFPSLKGTGKGDISGKVDVEGPDVHVSGDLPEVTIKGDAGGKIKGKQPEVVVGGDINVEDGSGFKMPDIHLPKFKIGGKGPKGAVSADAGINVDGSTDPESITFVVKGDVPSGNVKVKGGSQDEIAVGGDADVKGGGGFKMPSINLPDINFPSLKRVGRGDASVNVNVEGPDVHVSGDLPGGDVNIKGDAGVKIKGKQPEHIVGDDVEIEDGSGFRMPGIHLPKIKLGGKGPKGAVSADAGINVDGSTDPESITFVVKGDIPSGNVKIKGGSQDELAVGGDVDVKGGGGFKMPSIHMPDINFPSLKRGGIGDASVNVNVEGPDVHVSGDLPEVTIKGDAGGKIKGKQPEVVVGGDINVEDGSGFKIPDIHLPKFKIGGKGPKAAVSADAGINLDGSTDPESITFVVKGDVPSGNVKIKGGSQDEIAVGGDVDVKGGGGFKMPSIHMPDINFPSLKGTGKGDISGKVDVEGPDVHVSGDLPEVTIKGDAGGKIKGKQPEVVVGGDINVEDGSGFKMPDIHLPKFKIGGKGPKGAVSADAGINVGGSTDPESITFVVKGDVPSGNIKGKGGSQGEIAVGGDVHVKGGGGFKMPSIHMPDINFPSLKRTGKGDISGKVDVEGPDVHVSGDLPEVTIKGDAGGKIKGKQPEVVVGGDINVEDGSGFKMPDIHLPKFKIGGKGPKGAVSADAGINVGGSTDPESITFVVKGDVPSGNIKGKGGSQGEIAVGGDVHVKGGGGFKMPSIHMPDINFPSLKRTGKGDISGKVDVEGPDVPVSGDLPEVTIKGDAGGKIKGKQPELVVGGDINVEDGSGFKMPDIHLPKFKIGGKGPKGAVSADASINVDGSTDPESITFVVKGDVPSGNIKVKGGSQDEIAVGGDFDVKGGGGFKMSSIHMPDINFPSLKRTGKGDISGKVDVEGPDVHVSGDLPEVTIKGDAGGKIKGKQPEVVVGGDINVEDGSGFKMPDIHLPKFKIGGKGPKGAVSADAGINVDGSTDPESITFVVEGDVPSGNIKVKGGSQDEIAIGGDVDVKGGGGFKMPSIHMPDINFPSLKRGGKGDASVNVNVEGPDVHVGGELPGGDVNVKGDAGVKIKGKQPEQVVGGDVEIEDGSGFRMPGIHLPKIKLGGKGPKGAVSADAGINVDGSTDPESITFVVKGDVPSGNVKVKGGSQDELAVGGDIDVKGGGGFKMPSIHMPDINFPSLKRGGKGDASVNVNVEGPDVHVSGDPPEVTIKGDAGGKIKGKQPEVVVGGDINVEDGSGFKMPDIHLPKLKIGGKGPKAAVSADAGINVDGSTDPESITFVVKGDVPSGNVKIKGGSQDEIAVGGDVDVKGGGGFKMPSIHMPDINFPSLKRGGKGDASINVNVEGPDVHVSGDLPGGDVNIKGDAGVKIKGKQPEQVVGGDVEIEDGSGFKMPGIHLPKIKLGGKGPKGAVSADAGVNVDGSTDPESITFVVKGDIPSGNVKIKGGSQDELAVGGDVDVKGGGGFKMPSIHMPDINFPSLKRGGKGDASVNVNVEGPDVHVSGDLPEVTIKGDAGGKIKGKQPEVVVGGDINVEDGSGFKMPDIHLPKFKIGGKGPKAAVSADAGINVDGSTDPESITFVVKGDVPSGNIKVKGGSQDEIAVGADVDVKGGGGFKMPSIHMPDINFPSLKRTGKGDISGKVDVEGPDVHVSGDLPEVTIKGDAGGKIKGKQPEVVVGGDINVEDGSGFKMPDIHLPKFKIGGKGPKGAVSAEAGINVDGSADPDSVTFVVKGDIPSGNVKIKGGSQDEINVGGDAKGGGGFKMPSIHMPDINFPSLKRGGKGDASVNVNVEGPDVHVSGDLPGGDVNIKGDAGVKIKGKQPEQVVGGDVEVEDGFGFKMPSIHLPDINLPSLKISGRGPKASAEVGGGGDVSGTVNGGSGPESVTYVVKGDVPSGDVNVSGGGKADFKLPSINMPTIKFPARHTGKYVVQQGDVDVPGANVSGDIDGKGKVEVSGPSVDVVVKGPAIKSPSGKQEEVVIDDTHLHADPSVPGWKPSLKISGRGGLFDVSAGGKGDRKRHSSSSSESGDGQPDSITYIVTSDQPGGKIYAEKSKSPKGKENKWGLFGKKQIKVPSASIQGGVSHKSPKEEEVIIGGPEQYVEDLGGEVPGKQPLGSVNLNVTAPRVDVKTSGDAHVDINSPKIDIPDVKYNEPKHKKWNIFGRRSGEYNMSPELPDIPPVKLTYRGGRDADVQGSVGGRVNGEHQATLNFPSINVNLHHEIELPKVSAKLSFGAPEGEIGGDVNGSLGAEMGIDVEEAGISTSTPKVKSVTAGYDVSVKSRPYLDDSELGLDKSGRPVSMVSSEHGGTLPGGTLDASLDTTGSSMLLAGMYKPGEFSFDGTLRGAGRPQSASTAGTDGFIPSNLPHFVVIAIDFGTTFSGYAFSFAQNPSSIHMMRKWEGGDPGVINQKTPTTLLLTPEGEFHAFGFTARDIYHDLSPKEAKRWMYFEKFKMALHYNSELNTETTLEAANGTPYRALDVFTHALRYFREHALQEVSDQSGTILLDEDVRWVITVPAIWKEPAKQFMRRAAYQAGIAGPDNPEQLLIALEPEAASVYIRRQRLRQLIPESKEEGQGEGLGEGPSAGHAQDSVLLDQINQTTSKQDSTLPGNAMSLSFQRSATNIYKPVSMGQDLDLIDTRYMVADCGGGTVDITVYEMTYGSGKLKELYKATGGPYGSIGVDEEFEKLLVDIFGADMIEAFKLKRPAGWVDFMMAFESRKRAANPFKTKPLNVSPPFSFMDYHKKFRSCTVESAIRRYNSPDVKWSSQGMIRLMPDAMSRLFESTLTKVCEAIANVLNNSNVSGIKYIFLVGGFAESYMLQQAVRKQFSDRIKVLIPQDVSLTILKGAVSFGLDPGVVTERKSRMSYGVAVLHKFIPGKHPENLKAEKDGIEWCMDVFDPLVLADDTVCLGETVMRRYAPAATSQKLSVFNIYSSKKRDVKYVTDKGVSKCGTLTLQFPEGGGEGKGPGGRREVQARMTFGDTEIKVAALDVATGKCVRSTIDFLNK